MLLSDFLDQFGVQVLHGGIDLDSRRFQLVGDGRVVLDSWPNGYRAEHGARSIALKPTRQRRKIRFATVLEALHRRGHQTARIKPLIIVLQISLLLDSLEMLGNGPDCGGDVGLQEVLDELS